MVDLNRLSDLVDLYVYMPAQGAKKNMQGSPSMHYILSSNTKDKATAKPMAIPAGKESLYRNLEFCYLRIFERFKTFSEAFRFFDLNFNNRVSFNEFQFGFENLKVKLSSRD